MRPNIGRWIVSGGPIGWLRSNFCAERPKWEYYVVGFTADQFMSVKLEPAQSAERQLESASGGSCCSGDAAAFPAHGGLCGGPSSLYSDFAVPRAPGLGVFPVDID